MSDNQIKELILHKRSKTLELILANSERHCMTAEFLRVHSPSAEVKGHGNPKLVTGKQGVGITALSPVGHYGVRICFDDGHDTGLYTWRYLVELSQNQDSLWAKYRDNLKAADISNDEVAVRWVPMKDT